MADKTGSLLLNMQREDLMTDYTFIIQDTELKVHRNVVCCRGGKLKELVEEKPEQLEIDDMDLQTFTTLLE